MLTSTSAQLIAIAGGLVGPPSTSSSSMPLPLHVRTTQLQPSRISTISTGGRVAAFFQSSLAKNFQSV